MTTRQKPFLGAGRHKPPVHTSGRGLLAASDFTYAGHYVVDGGSFDGSLTFGRGLTHRYVGGQLRFLTVGYGGSIGADPLYEFHLGSGGYGSTLTDTQKTDKWAEVFSPALSGPNIGGGDEYGIWWDEAKGGLWFSQCTDYPGDGSAGSDTGDYATSCVTFRTLNSNGTISNFKGPYGFSGVGQRAIYGGVRAVPSSLQSLCGGHPYSYGFGGYTSRLAAGYTPSLGPMLLGGPDVTAYASPTAAISTSDFKVLADCRSGATNASDWYGAGAPASFDRGARAAAVTNYYDNGDPRPNPTTAPTVAPAAGAQWLSPSPDGQGRWVWGDTFDGAAVWVDGVNKYGFVAVASLATGKAYYANSTLNFDSREAELQVFDPARFGEVAAGTRQPWAVRPAGTKSLNGDLGPLGFGGAGSGFTRFVGGATFDATTKLLWLWLPGVSSSPYDCALAAYAVNC